ncbi:hypothetical protein ACSSS7_003477 [Eimeria intestinalis]
METAPPASAATAAQPILTHDHDSARSTSHRKDDRSAEGMLIATIDHPENAPPAAYKFGPRRRPHLLKGVEAAILVPLLVVFGVMFFCMRFHREAVVVGLRQRGLAGRGEEEHEGGEEELEDVLMQCLEKHNIFLAQQVSARALEPSMDVRAAKRLKPEVIAQRLFHHAHQASQAAASTPTPASSELSLARHEQKERRRKRPEVKVLQTFLTRPPESSPFAPLPSPCYLAGTGAEPLKLLPAEPSLEPTSESQEDTEEGYEKEDESVGAPSTSAAALANIGGPGSLPSVPARPWNPREHPFTRLPRRAPGVVTRPFIPGGFYHGDFSGFFSCPLLTNVMLELFKEEILEREELELLLRAAETLVYVASKRAKPNPVENKRPSNLLARLGWYFFVYDSLISAKEVLGPSMSLGAWWSDFTALYDTEYRLDPPTNTETKTYHIVKHHVDLVNMLSRALDTYKQGVRPPKNIVYRLKKALCCEETSPRHLAKRYGQFLLQAHIDFLAQNPDFREEFDEDDR